MADQPRRKSTIVRAYRSTGQVLVRAGLRTLDPVAPTLAAAWAARIWCTPPQSRPARRPDPRVPPGERFLVPLTEGGPARPGRRLRGRRPAVPAAGRGMVVAEAWGTGPVIYLLHGWGGRRGQLAGLVAPLLAAGLRVVALDAPGHGESGPGGLGGRRTTLPEVAAALAAVVSVAGPAHAVVSHSAGGGATALAVLDGLAAQRLVFISPMADPVPYLDPFARLLGLGPRSRARLPHRLERLVGRALADFDTPARAAAAGPGRLPPALVIHDRDDREVALADGRALAEAWPGATLLTTEGLGHRRILAAPRVIEATVAYLTADRPAGDGDAATPAAARGQRGDSGSQHSR
jgi:pimeloyl-ACP methyl ester carboxylesterase